MPDKKLPVPSARQAGFGLIELMVAIALGLLITAAVTAMAVNSLKMSSDTLKSARLNQDLGAVMQIMVNDIRRAGYSYCDMAANNSPDCPDDPSTEEEGNRVYYDDDGEDLEIGDVDNTNPPDDGDCILYSYNQDADPNKDEFFGFRRIEVNSVGVVQMADTTGSVVCDASNNNNWVSMTDPDVIDVTSLTFNTANSKCHNIDEETSVQIKPDNFTTKFACNESTKINLQQWDDSNSGWGTLADSITLPLKAYEDGDDDANNYDITSVAVRNVNISLEAELTGDSSVSKNLDVSTRVRNDHVYKIGES